MSPLRNLTRHPAYAVIAIVTMTLAVGANLVVFSFVNALWLRPLPIADPDRVVVIGQNFDIPDGARYSESGLAALRRATSFEGIAGQAVTSGMFEGLRPRLTVAGIQRPLEALGITPEYFAVLGVRLVGREFESGDGEGSGPAPVVISDRVWRSELKGRPDVLGLVVSATPIDLQVIGVAPANFHGARMGERTDLWLPVRLLPLLAGFRTDQLGTAIFPLVAIGRLRPGASLESARSEFAQGPRAVPDMVPLRQVFGAADTPMVRVRGGDVMAMSAITAAFVLIGGCATLVALALVHYEQRRRELALRAALGGTRTRLIRELAGELVVLAVAGTIGAVCFAMWAVGLLPHSTLPGGVDLGRLDLTIDWRVALVGLACCLLALGIGGVLPIVRFTRSRMALSLISPSATTSRQSLRLRRVALAVQVAATTVVLCAAVLFVRSVTHAISLGPGFDQDRALFATVQTRYRFWRGDDPALAARKASDVAAALKVVDQIKAVPGVEVVALGAAPLGAGAEETLSQRVPVQIDGDRHEAAFGWLAVSEGYLQALGVPLLAGRSGRTGEAVVTPALVREFWGDEWPIGRQFKYGGISATVVGISDVAFGSIRNGRPPAAFYFFMDADVPAMVNGRAALALTIRTKNPAALRAPIERLLASAFPGAPVVSVTTGRELVATDLGRERLSASMFSGFGVVALVLAVESIFGLVAYLLTSRRREFGVRIALGASRADIARRALWVSLEPTVIGATCGLVTAVLLARMIESYLFGVHAVDALTYAGVFAAMIMCATVAGATAASRVRHLSPIDSLRAE